MTHVICTICGKLFPRDENGIKEAMKHRASHELEKVEVKK